MMFENRRKIDPTEVIEIYSAAMAIQSFSFTNALSTLYRKALEELKRGETILSNTRPFSHYDKQYLNSNPGVRTRIPELSLLVELMSNITPNIERKDLIFTLDLISQISERLEQKALQILSRYGELLEQDAFQIHSYSQRDQVYSDFVDLAQRMDEERFGPRDARISIITIEGNPVIVRVLYEHNGAHKELIKPLVYTDRARIID